MPISQDAAYEQILSLSEPELREQFPFGIVREGNKWVKAKRGQGERKLSRLLADKEARQEKPRYLRASYSVPRRYVENPEAKGNQNDNYTLDPAKALKGEDFEMAVPESYQRQLTAEAHLRDAERRPALYEELARIEPHLQPQQKAELRRRIEGLKRSTHEKAA